MAYALTKKDWAAVDLSKLEPVSFKPEAFKRLVMDKKYKKLVTAMARSYTNKDTSFTDLVKGKGRGLVILLHGSPGTGKTLTAGVFTNRF